METIAFRYAEDDLAAANLAFYRAKLGRPGVRMLWLVVLLWIAGIAAFALSAMNMTMPVAILAGLTFGLLTLVLIHLINIRYLRRYARRNFAQQRSLADEYTFIWNAQGFESRSDRGSQQVDWLDLHLWSETDDLVMLYLAERLYIAIPKRALSAEQADEIRAYLSVALPAGGRRA